MTSATNARVTIAALIAMKILCSTERCIGSVPYDDTELIVFGSSQDVRNRMVVTHVVGTSPTYNRAPAAALTPDPKQPRLLDQPGLPATSTSRLIFERGACGRQGLWGKLASAALSNPLCLPHA